MGEMMPILQLAVGGFAFCVLAIWLKELLQVGVTLLLAPRFGMKVRQIVAFRHVWNRQDGGWSHSVGAHFHWVMQHYTSFDLDHMADDPEKRERQLSLIRALIGILAGVLLVVICLPPVVRIMHGEGSLPDAFLFGLAVGMLVHNLSSLCIHFYVFHVMTKNLMGYTQQVLKRLRAGVPFSEIGALPLEQLPYPNASDMEKMLYYSIYLTVLLDAGNIDAMRKPIHEMTTYYRNQDYLITNTLQYYWLVFYYSRYELNPSAATYFLNQVRSTIESDHDANAKRVLAYYAFGVEQDFPKARRFLNEAYAVLDKYSTGAERELERRLLNELDAFLKGKNA